MDILTYGQKELKDVINQLEEQLKTVIMPYQQIENQKSIKKLPKSETKFNDSEVYNQNSKKQRVDKNKCRKCKLSTIPTILHLLQQNDKTDANSNITMKSIRQQIAQQSQKKEEQSDQKVPYIAFDYSHQIVICRRCRFKFHSECVQIQGVQNEWLCDYCLNRIEQLKNSNQWDYQNLKQIKQQPNLTSEQKKIHIKILERIQKKKQIYIISQLEPTPNKQFDQISEFLSRYPLYKSSSGIINYPISEILAKHYPEVLNIKQKPQPQIIKSNLVEQILKIQTIYQIIQPNSKVPENFAQEYIEKNFYDILIKLITQYFDEFIFQNDLQFQHYCNQANAHTTSFLYLMNYLQLNDEDQNLLNKIWNECVLQIDQIINYNAVSKIDDIDFNNLQFQDQVYILSILSEGLYDLNIMKNLIKNKDQFLNKGNIYQNQLTSSNLKILLQSNYSLFINDGTYLGQDSFEQQYFYFTFFPNSIFVETKKGWGQYTISDLNELMNSLNQQGVNEQDLLSNLEKIRQIELYDTFSTPIKQKNKKILQQQYRLDIIEVIDKFIIIEESYTQFMKKKNLCWIKSNQKNSFFNLIKNQDSNVEQMLSAMKQFFYGLLQPISKKGEFVQPFKLFKFHFILINQLAIYIENASSLSNIYVSLLVLERVLDDKLQYMKQKEQMKIIVEKVKNKKILKEQQKQEQKKKKYKYDEEYQVAIKKTDGISNNQKSLKRNNNLKQISCFSCQKLFQNQDLSEQCQKCLQVFHKECLKQNKSLCQRCFQKKNRKFK